MMKSKNIAVIMSLYKNDVIQYVQLAVESILTQTFKDFDFYIQYDGPISSDVDQYLSSLTDERIKIQKRIENKGLAQSLNDLLSIVIQQGYEYIARMDADDISYVDRFEKQVKYLNENPELDVIGGAIEEMVYDGSLNGKVIHYPLTHQDCFNFFATRNPLAHPAVMFRSSFFDKVISYNASYKKNQDTELWYRAFKAGCKFGNLKDVVLIFRVSKDMYKRRGGTKFAKEVLKLRNEINKGLGYGLKATLFGYAYFIMAISPGWVKKFAYSVFR